MTVRYSTVKRAQARCLEMTRGALGLLVDDFLYTYDPATLHAQLCFGYARVLSIVTESEWIQAAGVLDMLCAYFVE